MELEQVKPDKPRIAYVGYLTIFMLVAILLAAVVIVGWRARSAKRAPYSKHPTSQLILPAGIAPAAPGSHNAPSAL